MLRLRVSPSFCIRKTLPGPPPFDLGAHVAPPQQREQQDCRSSPLSRRTKYVHFCSHSALHPDPMAGVGGGGGCSSQSRRCPLEQSCSATHLNAGRPIGPLISHVIQHVGQHLLNGPPQLDVLRPGGSVRVGGRAIPRSRLQIADAKPVVPPPVLSQKRQAILPRPSHVLPLPRRVRACAGTASGDFLPRPIRRDFLRWPRCARRWPFQINANTRSRTSATLSLLKCGWVRGLVPNQGCGPGIIPAQTALPWKRNLTCCGWLEGGGFYRAPWLDPPLTQKGLN